MIQQDEKMFGSSTFRGNEYLKTPNEREFVTIDQFKKYTEEIIKCSEDILYFANTYYTIINLDKGKQIITLYPKQEEYLKFLEDPNNKRMICLSARQTGKCFSKNGKVTIKNKKTGKTEQLTIKDFIEFNKIIFLDIKYDKKFIAEYKIYDYEILTDSGFVDIIALYKTIEFTRYVLKTTNFTLECADEHIVFDENYNEALVKNLYIGQFILTQNGKEQVVSVEKTNITENMYDFELGDNSNHRYYTSGILSHNTVGYSAWCTHIMCFNEDKKILILANKESTAKGILKNIMLAFELLPKWLKPGIKEWNKRTVEFSNGCVIEVCASASDAARSKSANVLVVDESAFIPPHIMSSLWSSVYPVVSSSKDSKVLLVSTPNGTGNHFHNCYNSAVTGKKNNDGWKCFQINWWDVPNRDETWKQQQIDSFNGDMTRFNQEYGNCVSSDTLIKVKINDNIKLITIKDLYIMNTEQQ